MTAKAQTTYQHDIRQIQKDSITIIRECDSLKLKHSVDSTLQVLHDEIYFYCMDSVYGKYNLNKSQIFQSNNNASYWMSIDCYVWLLTVINDGEIKKWIEQYFNHEIDINNVTELLKDKEDICLMILIEYGYKIK